MWCSMECLLLVLVAAVIGTANAVGGQFLENHACFSTVFEVSCSPMEVIVFEAARYGRNDTRIAQDCGTPYQRNCDIDVHFTLNRRCAGKQKCSLAVNTALFGDPCGYEEFLKVKYQCVRVKDMTQSCHDDSSKPLYDNGYITSPNYPSKYYRDAECTWTIVVQKRQTIQITFYDFELNVKMAGQCADFLEISSGNRVYFKDCGAMGRQSTMIDSNKAVVRFKTSPNSLTQRGFFIHFQAVGPGCPDIEKLPHGSVLYYVHNDILYANATCERGYIILGTMDDQLQLKCMGKYWSKSIQECIAIPPNTTPIGLLPRTHPYETTTEDSHGAAIGGTFVTVFVMCIALGVVSALLLLTLLLVVIIYIQKRRRHRKAEKDHWRVVVNNLQENEINSFDEDQNWKTCTLDSAITPTCNIKKAAKKGSSKKGTKQNNNYCMDDSQGRNLLVSSGPQYRGGGYYEPDGDDIYAMDYSDIHREFQDQCSTPIKGYAEPIYNPRASLGSRRNSRSSRHGFGRQPSREDQLADQDAPPRNKSFCVECGTAAVPGRQARSQKDLRHKRTKSGQWGNRTIAYTPSPPEVPIYGFPKVLTQSAPDLLELGAPPHNGWTLHPDQTYAPVPTPKPCPTVAPTSQAGVHSPNRELTYPPPPSPLPQAPNQEQTNPKTISQQAYPPSSTNSQQAYPPSSITNQLPYPPSNTSSKKGYPPPPVPNRPAPPQPPTVFNDLTQQSPSNQKQSKNSKSNKSKKGTQQNTQQSPYGVIKPNERTINDVRC